METPTVCTEDLPLSKNLNQRYGVFDGGGKERNRMHLVLLCNLPFAKPPPPIVTVGSTVAIVTARLRFTVIIMAIKFTIKCCSDF